MIYTIVIGMNNRIEGGGTIPSEFASLLPENVIIVSNYPSGSLQDYLYINGEFVYDPILKEEPEEITYE